MIRRKGWRPSVAAVVGMMVVVSAMVVPPWLLARWREQRLVALSAPHVQADWDAFRDRMQRESGRDGPVQRKVPKSAEPPELVWMRDYWRLAIVAWFVFVGLITACTALLVRGGLASTSQDGPGRRRHDEEQHQRDAQHAEE